MAADPNLRPSRPPVAAPGSTGRRPDDSGDGLCPDTARFGTVRFGTARFGTVRGDRS